MRFKSLEGVTKDQVKEMSLKEIQGLYQKVAEEKQLEEIRTWLLNYLDVKEEIDKEQSKVIDTEFVN